jgi:hypothetical protein
VCLVAKWIANHLAVAVKDVVATFIDVHIDLLNNPLHCGSESLTQN